jgi:MYXO-CTERM domain-containing protein
MKAILPFACLAILLLSPLAAAGTPDNPEVVDPADDADLLGTLDITGVYVNATDANVTFHLVVPNLLALPDTDAGACTNLGCAALAFTFQVEFVVVRPDGSPAPTLPGYGNTYLAYRVNAPPSLRTVAAYRATDQTVHSVSAVDGSAGDGEVVISVPRSDPALNIPAGSASSLYRITGLFAYSAPQLCSPHSSLARTPVVELGACSSLPLVGVGGDNTLPFTSTTEWDRAPDTDFGGDFVFPVVAPPSEPTPTVVSSTSAPSTPPPAPAPSASPHPSGTSSPSSTSPAPTITLSGTSTPVASAQMAGKKTPAPEAALVLATLGGLAAARRRLNG